jgi:hypothetical protein
MFPMIDLFNCQDIWSDDNSTFPHNILQLQDPNDDNIILGIPEDIDPSTLPSDEPVRKVKIIQKHVKKSRMLLNRLKPFIIIILY